MGIYIQLLALFDFFSNRPGESDRFDMDLPSLYTPLVYLNFYQKKKSLHIEQFQTWPTFMGHYLTTGAF